jgi:putative transposase
VQRNFTATEPNQLWVTDLTYVATWAGMAYVCLIIDAFSRRIVGWRVASHMRTGMVLDALDMARWSRGTSFGGPSGSLRRRLADQVQSILATPAC